MCKVIAISNQKGGTAKSTTASNLGIGLARSRKRVLLIDADAQGSLTASLGFREPDKLKDTLAKVMENVINDIPMDDSHGILHHEEGVELLPGKWYYVLILRQYEITMIILFWIDLHPWE